ncbi:hypothetical protein [Spirochaeta africana]|uniref:Outer membrane protein beta-barrel domain-containing protein n=1 Tax=Spirochaeta africana (strain ATCC 700263 / DSM 8902 / Z-7692) TaxID=889378 RepID=H9UMM5_SPIAZ|nr:hypothetical protein [Spirochaeta africana]AFG38768.1 hypothetical protein Spiaf_2744 [Spirochaeta africana DSM 8902]
MPRRTRIGILAAAIVLSCLLPAMAQEFSEQQEIAVFGLSYDSVPVRIEIPRELQNMLEIEVIIDNPRTGTRRDSKAGTTVRIEQRNFRIPTPEEVRSEFERGFTNIDQLIREVFVRIGRFDVVGEAYSIDAEDVDGFIRALRDFRSDAVELPEEVQLGRQAFTEQDFRRLTDGYYLVIPSVSYYRAELTSEATYRVEIQVSFAFIDMETARTFERFTISSSGSGENLSRAISSAVSSLPGQLDFRIRTVPEFQIMTGITDLIGRQVLIEFGRNMGLNVGDEFVILTARRVGAYDDTQETGLIYVTEVRENFSFGVPIYADPRPQIGDQLREVPRGGGEVELYGGVQSLNMPLFAGDDVSALEMVPIVGLRFTASRGFYPIRPVVKLEFPFLFANDRFTTSRGTYLGGTFAFGAEYLLILGRTRLSPYVMFGGTGGAFTSGDDDDDDERDAVLSHIGVSGGLRMGYHVSRDTVLYLEPGLTAYVGMQNLPSVMGPSLTFGINFK